MSISPATRPISLREVAEHRVWCPVSGGRITAGDDRFEARCCCIGPRCAAWTWLSAGDAVETERRVCHLVPPHFSAKHRIRLASQLFPTLLETFRALATGNADTNTARATLLSWARTDWRPEQALPEPETWRRLVEPFWDEAADTVAVELGRTSSDDARFGACGLKQVCDTNLNKTDSTS